MKILSRPKGNAEEYGRWSVNPYKGCPHGCLYCYLKKGVWSEGLGGDTPKLKEHIVSEEHAYHVAMAEILEHREEIIRDGWLFMTFTSDPCIEETRRLFFMIVKGVMEKNIPVTLLTKSADFTGEYFYENIRWRLFLKEYGHDVSFGWTLTGHDELEPNASTNEQRIAEMGRVHRDGFKVWASIEPVITFDASFEMIRQALDAGCQHFKIGLMTKNTKVCRSGFSFGGHDFAPYKMDECVDFVEHVMALTDGRATVYWKQSFVDYLQQSEKHPQPVRGMEAREFLSQWKHSVGNDWSMFNQNRKE